MENGGKIKRNNNNNNNNKLMNENIDEFRKIMQLD